MKITIAAGLIILGLFPACTTTTNTTNSGTLEERTLQQHVTTYSAEPAPPAEGPQDVPAAGPAELYRNPALMPSPLLRMSAASGP